MGMIRPFAERATTTCDGLNTLCRSGKRWAGEGGCVVPVGADFACLSFAGSCQIEPLSFRWAGGGKEGQGWAVVAVWKRFDGRREGEGRATNRVGKSPRRFRGPRRKERDQAAGGLALGFARFVDVLRQSTRRGKSSSRRGGQKCALEGVEKEMIRRDRLAAMPGSSFHDRAARKRKGCRMAPRACNGERSTMHA